MKNKLTHNLGWKIFSFLMAFIMWLVVLNIEDPASTQTFSGIEVRFINTDVLTDQGLMYEVEDGSNIIRNVTVSGPRSFMEQLKSEDIVAVADFNDLTDEGTVPIEFSSNRFGDKITKIKGSTTNVKLNVEAEKTVRLVLKVNAVGEVAEGYLLGSMTPDQNQIIITGGESVIDRISKAVAEVDVTDATANIATYADVVLLDSEGNEIESSSLIQKVTSVRVSVEVLTTKRVTLSFGTSGTPASGYAVTDVIESQPSLITVAGTAANLNSLSRIDVPSEVLNVTGQSGNMTTTIDIDDYLPAGITLADPDFNGKVSVTVNIEPTISKTVFMHPENVSVNHEPEGFSVELEGLTERDPVKLQGLEDKLIGLSGDNLEAVVDMNKALSEAGIDSWKPGTYTATADFLLPDGVTTEKILEVRIVIKSKE